MRQVNFEKLQQGRFVGEVRDDLAKSLGEERLDGLREEIESAKEGVLAKGRHRVVVLSFEIGGEIRQVAVKAFGGQQAWKDRFDLKRGSKAARSFQAAQFLEAHGVSTPTPLASLERWEGDRLVESYFLSDYLEGLTSLKSELSRIYREGETCDVLVSLLEKVGAAMKKMHDAGFYHRDLGNQNMELSSGEDGGWTEVNFIDLNRGKIRAELTMKERALDFARLRLPSGFLGILVRIYWQAKAPSEFKKEMAKARRRFDFWVKTRRWRHPIKSRKKERRARRKGFLRLEDVWIWDQRSAQASITLDGPDRRRCQSKWNHLRVGGSALRAAPAIWKEYRRQLEGAFQKKVELSGRIGMALEPADLEFQPQLNYLEDLGNIPVLLRFGHHEGKVQWEKTLGFLEELHEKGHEIMVAILQDRRAVLEPDSWREFLEFVLQRIEGKVAMVELCHVVNRVKWGLHNLDEHAALLEPAVALKKKYPEIQFSGPACIDFEYHYLVAALGATPKGLHYDALSHHLYVDRRGAPENKQGKFGTVEKAALLRTIAGQSNRCDDRVIISEVNWPLVGTGVWSPVAASYLSPGAKASKVSVSEEKYGCFMIRYLVLTLCSGFVDQVYWWRLVAHGFGLIDERAEGGWRERIGFQMLKVFLAELGTATFVEKLETEDDVYVLRFERERDLVTMIWCNGRTFAGPWPTDFKKVLDSQGKEIELSEVGDAPVYLLD
jgi:hypothetical protein